MTHQEQVSVVGGGIGGLVAAVTAAECGASVTLYEAHQELGGRWRVTDGPYALHEGPHVIYRDGPTWAWLAERRLLGRTCGMPARALGRFYFRYEGRLSRRPPMALLRVLASRGEAPVGASFTEWATARFDAKAARVAAAASGVGLFHPDPGELSAAFVFERLKRVFAMPPTVAYRQGGWGSLMDDIGAYARTLGVRIVTGSRVEELPGGTTIVATSLPAARRLLRDDSLSWPSGQVGMLDLGLRESRRDAFVVSDLDGGGWLETFSMPDPSIAPKGCSVTPVAAATARRRGSGRHDRPAGGAGRSRPAGLARPAGVSPGLGGPRALRCGRLPGHQLARSAGHRPRIRHLPGRRSGGCARIAERGECLQRPAGRQIGGCGRIRGAPSSPIARRSRRTGLT